ncbi:MAG: PEP-CTERM sorting domain-containing protein [Chthoniobacterales bacterium]
MLIKALASSLLIALVASSASAVGTFYTTEASFLANTNPTRYLEDFSGFTFGNPLDGTQTSYVAPGANGFGWTASAALGLYSNVSALSTNAANDPITILFTGLPVTAFGGIFANTDINGNIIPGTVTVMTSDGGSQTVTTNGFLGYTSNVTITSITMLAAGTTNNWVQVDHFYTGTAAVPEPGTIALLSLGAVGLVGAAIKRRRQA